ncbi:class IV adenylate cyclase [Nocardiopsis sp. RSe5-2]|uniref:Class IV adenylate cyclase n=1 Tax=Nocardiopsis endophytica TaxID=3018445 RepID=A0ABT4U2W3_9ACTN|nr:class IV adenylate cyclase [Nocardiopsis endophytica]MDA2810800.1 class IV adenylate cyclase [Nocardiopsis endophytica]
MPIEAELKARVRDVEGVRRRLRALAAARIEVYRDTYYDGPDRRLTSEGRELRVRSIERGGEQTVLLTYKEPAVDTESGSKPEHETRADSAEALDAMLTGLGFEPLVAFEKHCANHAFTADGRECLATLVTVPELDGTFIEVETIVSDEDLDAGLGTVRRVLMELGIEEGDLTTEQYTDAVMERRR